MTQEHFEALAENHDEQIPGHIRSHLLSKKTDLILARLFEDVEHTTTKLKGIDFGCGTGWCVKRLREMGPDVWELDISEEMLKHETNWDVLLFRLCMHYVFPLTNKIDRDHRQHAVSVGKLRDVEGWRFLGIKYFTFLPNVTPRFVFPFLKRFEGFLERGTRNRFGAHYMVSLERVG